MTELNNEYFQNNSTITELKEINTNQELTITNLNEIKQPEQAPSEEVEQTLNFKKMLLTLKNYIKFFFIFFKEVFLYYVLICASVTNFSILNIPYTLLAISLIFFIFNTDNSILKIKNFLVLIFLILTVFNLVIKITFIGIYFNHNEDKNNLFNNLGLACLVDKQPLSFVNCFLGDIIAMVTLVLMRVFRIKGDDNTLFKQITKFNYDLFSNFLFFSVSICTLIKTSVNISFASMLFALIIHIGLILWSLNLSKKYQKDVYIILMLLLVLHILGTHVLNIYLIRIDYKDYYIIQYFGVLEMKVEANFLVDYFLSVLVCILCTIAFKLNSAYKPKAIKSGIKYSKTVKMNFWYKMRLFILDYIFSPYFSLHLCRLAIIYLIYSFINFPIVCLIIWLFYSFLTIDINRMRIITYILGWPVLIYLYNSFMISNIPNLIDNIDKSLNLYGIQVFKERVNFKFITLQLTIFLFAIFSKILTRAKKYQSKNQSNKEFLLAHEESFDASHKSVSFRDLLAKLVVKNFDKISLVFMYLIAIQEVNILHTCKIYLIFSLNGDIFSSVNHAKMD
jgi:hypothetical protein